LYSKRNYLEDYFWVILSFDGLSDDLSGANLRRMAKDCETCKCSQSLVVLNLEPFHGVLAVTLRRPVLNSHVRGQGFESPHLHTKTNLFGGALPHAVICSIAREPVGENGNPCYARVSYRLVSLGVPSCGKHSLLSERF